MRFEHALEQADEPLRGAFRPGLRALAKRDRTRVRSRRDRSAGSSPWTGSVDLDQANAVSSPDATRWDYGIGYIDPKGSEHAIWVEVHSAHTKHVVEVLAKLTWLKHHLNRHAQHLLKMSHLPGGSQPFFWLARGRIDIRPGTSEERRLARSGLNSPRTVLVLP